MKKFVRIDFDNIGEIIEYKIFNEKYQEAQNVTTVIQNTLKDSINYINSNFQNVEMLVVGADDVLFTAINMHLQQIEKLKDFYYLQSKFTVSIGIGNSINETMMNLRIAKISGKNRIIGI